MWWAATEQQQRVLEQLRQANASLPKRLQLQLGPNCQTGKFSGQGGQGIQEGPKGEKVKAFAGEHCPYGETCKFLHPPAAAAAEGKETAAEKKDAPSPVAPVAPSAGAGSAPAVTAPTQILTQLLQVLTSELLETKAPKEQTLTEKLAALLNPPAPPVSPLQQIVGQLAAAFSAPAPVQASHPPPQVQGQWQTPPTIQYAAPHVQYAAPHVQHFAPPHAPQFLAPRVPSMQQQQQQLYVPRLPVPGAHWPMYGQ